MNRIDLTILIVAGVAALIAVIVAVAADSVEDFAEASQRLALVIRAIALFSACAALVVLLIRSVFGAPAAGLWPLVLPILGGVLIGEPHWAPALALGAALAMFLWRGPINALGKPAETPDPLR
jgi:hypothetical protein